jgi:hypothetical protein
VSHRTGGRSAPGPESITIARRMSDLSKLTKCGAWEGLSPSPLDQLCRSLAIDPSMSIVCGAQ